MSITATDTERCNQVISGGSAYVKAYRDMLGNLCEGDFGHAFGIFYSREPIAAAYVVKDAMQKFQANRTKWVNEEQFTLNYHTQVIKWSNYAITTEWTKKEMFRVWDMFAEMVREFATGE